MAHPQTPRKTARISFALLMLTAAAPSWLMAQGTAAAEARKDTTQIVEVETRDGNVFLGTLLSETEERIVIRTDVLGELTINRADIRRITRVPATQIRDGEVWYRSAHDTRYFFQSNAFNLRKGEGYYQNAWVLFNQVSYGLTRNFSMGAGFVPTFLFGEASTPVWITPKLSIPLKQESLTVGVGGIMGTLIGEGGSAGILYGNLTVGDRNRNVTVAGGYGYAEEESGEVLFGLSGSVRVRPKLSLMTENYVFAETFISFVGFRHIGRRLAIDGALAIPEGVEVVVPWLSVTAPFMTRKAEP